MANDVTNNNSDAANHLKKKSPRPFFHLFCCQAASNFDPTVPSESKVPA